MEAEDLKSEVRRLTARIGRMKRSGGPAEHLEALREGRALVALTLAREHDVWLLINPQGRTEFVDRTTWTTRMKAWLQANGIDVNSVRWPD